MIGYYGSQNNVRLRAEKQSLVTPQHIRVYFVYIMGIQSVGLEHGITLYCTLNKGQTATLSCQGRSFFGGMRTLVTNTQQGERETYRS